MSQKVYDCIVVGGGISGVTFAHYLKKEGKAVLVLEKNKNTGGQLQTGHLSVQPDFWYELGSHTCYNSYTSLLSLSLIHIFCASFSGTSKKEKFCIMSIRPIFTFSGT